MSAGEELDWSRVEVVLLGNPAEGEEVEALLVIPAVDDGTDGQQLWKRTRAPMNPQKATYARVKVKKVAQGSAGGIQVTSSNVQLRLGRELPPVFKYCPYRYYGKLVPFASELCREAWERWYEKQHRPAGADLRAERAGPHPQRGDPRQPEGGAAVVWLGQYRRLVVRHERLLEGFLPLPILKGVLCT